MKYIIKNNGPLQGRISIGGAKNSALGLIAATLLTEDTVILNNVPNVSDVNNMLEAISFLGGEYEFKDNILKISCKNINNENIIDYDCITKIRASYYFLGSLLGKYKKATVAMPGGCQIGVRPINLHLKGFEALGAKTNLEDGNITVVTDGLVGKNIYLDYPSVGATINIMLASVLASGMTVINNSAKEPHIVDIANMLNEMGANIKGAGTDKIRISGVEKLHGVEYSVIPDQIEAGTFMIAAAITKGDVYLDNIFPKHLHCVAYKLKEMGVSIDEGEDWIRVYTDKRLKASSITTAPYPGFPTDLQPQISVALGLAEGSSLVEEAVFENRFIYTDELARMGSKMCVIGNVNLINGIEKYKGAVVTACDLRAGAALVLAGLVSDKVTTVKNIEYIKRGYEDFDGKLRSLGADIKEV